LTRLRQGYSESVREQAAWQALFHAGPAVLARDDGGVLAGREITEESGPRLWLGAGRRIRNINVRARNLTALSGQVRGEGPGVGRRPKR